MGMIGNDHRIDARRGADQRFGDGDADAGGLRGIDQAFLAQFGQRPTQAAHDVAALHGDFARQRRRDDARHGGAGRVRQAKIGAAKTFLKHLQGDIDRHIIVQRRIGIGRLKRHDLGVAIAAIGGDDDAGAGIVDAVRQRLVRKAAEHRRVDHPDTLGRFSPIKLGRHVGHVERDAVAGLESEFCKRHRALGSLQQHLAAGDGDAIYWRTAAIIGRQIPAVTLENEGGFGTIASEHVAIELVESGIGAAAFEPAEVGRIIGIKGAGPGGEIFAQIGAHRRCGFSIPARPLAVSPAAQPGRAADDINQPMQITGGDIAMKGTRISQHGSTHRIPIGAGAHRIDAGGRNQCARGGGGIIHARSAQLMLRARRERANRQETLVRQPLEQDYVRA